MRLKQVVIKNFKTLSDVTIDLHAHATALIGRNAAGKSSVLQALDMLLGYFGGRVAVDSAWRQLHHTLVTGKASDLTIEIEAVIELNAADLGAVFGENLSTLISDAKVIPFLYLQMGKAFESGIGFRVDGDSKRIPTDPASSFSSGIDDLLEPTGIDSIGQIDVDLSRIADKLRPPILLSTKRFSDRRQPAEGASYLDGDASNLIRFLLTLQSRDREAYVKIEDQLRSVVPEVVAVGTPLLESGQVEGIIRDVADFDVDIDWDQVSEGTRQTLQILSFASRAPLLMIEEPELSLHPFAAAQLIRILESLCAASGSQLICSTHSPAIVDTLSLDQIRVAVRRSDSPINSFTVVEDLSDFRGLEAKLRRYGISLGPLLAQSGRTESYPKFLFVVEGRTDRLIWQKLFERGDVDETAVQIVGADGWQDACAITNFVRFLRNIGIHYSNYLLVVDSDGDPARRSEEVKAVGLSVDEFIVLNEKELESYLLDPAALAAVTNSKVGEVRTVIGQAKRRGKEELQRVLRQLGINSMDPGIMLAIVQHMIDLPADLTAVIDRVKADLTR